MSEPKADYNAIILTWAEQKEIRDYLRAREQGQDIDPDKLPLWLAELDQYRRECEDRKQPRHTYTAEYFKNRVEQGRIKERLWQAFPVNVQYFNAIIALSEMLQRLVQEAFGEDVMTKAPIENAVAAGDDRGPVWNGDEAEGDG